MIKRVTPIVLMLMLGWMRLACAQSVRLPYLHIYPFGRALTTRDLATTTAAQRRLVRNAIFARHGRPFKDPQLDRFFASQRWYRKDTSWQPQDDDRRLSPLEKQNAQFLLAYQTGPTSGAHPAPSRDYTIRPGQGVGKVRLGMSRRRVLSALGRPQESQPRPDGLSQDVWRWPHRQSYWASGSMTIIYRRGAAAQIEVASERFSTVQGVSTRSTLSRIQREVGPLRRTVYIFPGADGAIAVRDSARSGIAFEFYVGPTEDVQPMGILVHPPGRRIIPIAREAFGHGFQLSRPARSG